MGQSTKTERRTKSLEWEKQKQSSYDEGDDGYQKSRRKDTLNEGYQCIMLIAYLDIQNI